MISIQTLNRMMQIDEHTVRFVEDGTEGVIGAYTGLKSGLVYCEVATDEGDEENSLFSLHAETVTGVKVDFLTQSRADAFRYLEELLYKEFAFKQIIRETD